MGVCMAVAAGMALVARSWPLSGEHAKQQGSSNNLEGEGGAFTDDPLQKMLEERLEF